MMHMHHEPVDPLLLSCACTTVRKAGRAVGRIYDAALATAGMNANQLAILRALGRNGPMPLSRLAAAMVMDRTSLYRALDPLERSGWIEVDQAPSGRARIARLTPAGERARDGAAAAWESAQSRVVAAFGTESWRDLSGQLVHLIEVARRLETAQAGAGA